MAKRKKSKYRPQNLPKTCARCGSGNLTIHPDATPVPIRKSEAAPFFCSDCRVRARVIIDQEREARLQCTARMAEAISLNLVDNRTERWLETYNDVIRQSRATPQHPWIDTPDHELWPETKQKTPRIRSCSICKQSPTETYVQMRIKTGQQAATGICATCAKLASNTTYSVRLNLHGSGNAIVEFRLTQCPGCTAPVLNTKPPNPCASCIDGAIAAAGRLPDQPDIAREIRKLMEMNPAGICRRCDAASRQEPYHCPTCRADYLMMPEKMFPAFSTNRTPGKCCVCRQPGAAIAVHTAEPGYHTTYSVCTTCARIACHQTLQHYSNGKTLQLSICEGCGAHRNVLPSGLCPGCNRTMSALENELTKLCDYLWSVLENPEGEPIPQPPPGTAQWLRHDATVKRQDAPENRRLNQQLSRAICREYVSQQREIPELAIRFNVTASTIRNVLNGKTWAKHTADIRPQTLRPEPRRTRPPVERPPTITVSRLKGELGWTDSLIKQHLGDEDVTLKNPHYRSSAPMRLYHLHRVREHTAKNPDLQRKLAANLERRQKHTA